MRLYFLSTAIKVDILLGMIGNLDIEMFFLLG